jgi:hypothetical protein
MNPTYDEFAYLQVGMVIDFFRKDGKLQRGEITEVRLVYPAFLVVKFYVYREGQLVTAKKAIWPGDTFRVVQDAVVPEASRYQANQGNDPEQLEEPKSELNESPEHENKLIIPEAVPSPEANIFSNERSDEGTSQGTCAKTNEATGNIFFTVVMLIGLIIGLSFGAIMMSQTQGIYGNN